MEAQQAARALFEGGAQGGSVPTTELSKADLGSGMDILTLMQKANLIPSRGEGRRLIQQGGVKLDGEKVPAFDFVVTEEMFKDGSVLIQKGKKVFHKINLV